MLDIEVKFASIACKRGDGVFLELENKGDKGHLPTPITAEMTLLSHSTNRKSTDLL